MQTFLPYPDLKESAEALRNDRERLGKQRLETMQLIQSISQTHGESGKMGLSRGWQFHPAARMWAMDGPNGEKTPYLLGLLKYQEEVIKVWLSKGYKDTCWEKSRACFSAEDLARYDRGEYELPPWFGDPAFHKSHRQRLVDKAPEIYGPLFPDDTPIDDYPFWPGPTLDEARAAAGLPPSKSKKKAPTKAYNPPSVFEQDQERDVDSEADIIGEEVEGVLNAPTSPVHVHKTPAPV